MKWLKNKSWTYWLRVIHRDLGFLMVGVCIIYGVSGMLLNHMDGKDPAFHTVEKTVTLPSGLDLDGLTAAWKAESSCPNLKRIMPIDKEHYRLLLEGGIGVYSVAQGTVDYEIHEKKPVIYWFNRLHYNRVQGWNLMGDFFAVSLIFFAISGLFMVKGSKGLAGRGKWYLLVGVLIPVLYILLG